jgi:hypothetical protein
MTAVPQTDPNARLPKGAKRAAERADELHKQTYKKADEGKPTDGDKKAGEEVVTPAEAPAKPAEAAAPEVALPSNQPAPPSEDWEHRYNSMRGRYERAEEHLRALTARIGELEGELEEAKRTTTRARPEPTTERLITDQERQDYGEEFLTVVGKKAKEIASAETSELHLQLAALTKQLQDLGGTVVKSAQEKMFTALDSGCSDWQKINTDPNFIAWLQLPDTYSGAIRHSLLKAAFERNDSPRVLAFFNGFLAEEAAVAPAKPAGDLVPAAQAPGKVSLETLAAPGRAKSPAATSAPAEKPIIQRDQIAAFYTSVAQGKYRGKDEEKARLERMIFEAQQDDRIR